MSTGMTHEDAREALDALALDALDASERDAVLAHLAGCAVCRAELVALQETVGDLAYAVQPLPMQPAQRDRIRARLLARAATDARGAHRTAVATPSTTGVREGSIVSIASAPSLRHRPGVGGWLAIAASLIAVVSVAQLLQVRRERDSLRETMQSLSAERGLRVAVLDSLRAAVADRDKLIVNLTGPRVAVMTLAATGTTAPSARMFWDQSVDAWTFVAHNLPAPKAGRTYQLWLVTATAKISAGTFMPGANGNAIVRATYALDPSALAAVAVTDEPSAGSEQPTTTPMIVGTADAK